MAPVGALGAGFGLTVTKIVLESLQPRFDVATNLTANVELVKYDLVGLATVALLPSPKVQAYVIVPLAIDDVLVNTNELVLKHCVALFTVKPTVGFGFTVTAVVAESIHPLLLVATSFII